jgi:mycofactocin system creatininase family protein
MADLVEATWAELATLPAPALLAIPIGATEQHGPHLPLGTDTEIAMALAARLAVAEESVLVGPALAYGASGEHADFPGTISIGAAATELALVELGRSAAASFERVLFVSTHGGNAVPLTVAVELLRHEGRDVRAFSPRWGGDAHAGHTETSLMLAIAPEQVRTELAVPGNVEPIVALLPRLREAGVRASAANGVLGDPTGASAADGERLLEAAVAELRELVAAWGGVGAGR